VINTNRSIESMCESAEPTEPCVGVCIDACIDV
jgi:hypothetical protein